jgi:hypothetical protein
VTVDDKRTPVQPARGSSIRPQLVIGGIPYFTAADIARAIAVSRQTLWRWRRDAKIPAGKVYRDKQVVFTEEELARIREYAHRLKSAATRETPMVDEGGLHT